ncbi:NAD(P)-dependent oxidoreductase [Hyphomicrobium sp.]|uniref:NAD-dependent epimerase/dehydratase family protein n=1 Tax=Hyphomicrobium sp. TaxID=82 RepID=UPI0025C28FCE|nr:NAD-dependent epimerase/dehydratase family protein [Hyphomicrobium sp.]
MKVVVSGAAGFVGYHLAVALADMPDVELFCVDSHIRGEDDEAYHRLQVRANVRAFNMDLNDRAALDQLPADPDYIFHLAALNGTQNFYERPFDVVRCCTLPTIFLLDRYRDCKSLKRFVYASSSEAYASTVSRFNWPVPTDESVPLGIDDVTNVRWSYGGSKMHGEIAVVAAAQQFKLPFSIIRYHNVYGPRMGDKHVMPDFLMRARKGEFVLYGHKDTRTFLYIEDAVRATIDVSRLDSCKDEIVNIGGGREIEMGELGKIMMDLGGFEGQIDLQPSPKGSVSRRAPDLAKFKRLTGFEERWTLEDGLKQTMAFYLA